MGMNVAAQALLFRLREPTSGSVLIDGLDVARLGLQLLRRRLAILPQDDMKLYMVSYCQ